MLVAHNRLSPFRVNINSRPTITGVRNIKADELALGPEKREGEGEESKKMQGHFQI